MSRLHGVERVIVSAPFGNWLRFAGCTSTLGTFTREYRGGLLYRAWRCLLTLRYDGERQAWTNKLGLPNPGIDSVPFRCSDRIVSLHGFCAAEWTELASRVDYRPLAIELNLSCPNVNHAATVSEVAEAVELLVLANILVIAKLPPVRWMELAVPLWNAGVRAFHCCNTLPSLRGGVSGKPLKPLSLRAVEEVKCRWGDAVTVIGGGGVTSPEDVRDYLCAGADHVAIGSMLLNPFNWRRVKELVHAGQEICAGADQVGLLS